MTIAEAKLEGNSMGDQPAVLEWHIKELHAGKKLLVSDIGA
jgi:hypothetical protein